MQRAEVPDGSREYNRVCKFRAWENIFVTAWAKWLLVFATETINLLQNYIMPPSLPKFPSIHMIGYGHYMGVTINIYNQNTGENEVGCPIIQLCRS